MIRTQINLTDKELEGLSILVRCSGKTRSELIREAVDRFVEQSIHEYRKAALKRVAGMWKDRTDLPDFDAMRKESDRRF